MKLNFEKHKFIINIINLIELSFLRNFGAQSIVIAVKKDKLMYCFFCGEKNCKEKVLDMYQVPVCDECIKKPISLHYKKKNLNLIYPTQTLINPPSFGKKNEVCYLCRKSFITDEIFENNGFSVSVCDECIKKPDINMKLSNEYFLPMWRRRGQIII